MGSMPPACLASSNPYPETGAGSHLLHSRIAHPSRLALKSPPHHHLLDVSCSPCRLWLSRSFYISDMFGTAAFAFSGVLVAGRLRMDGFYVMVLAAVTAMAVASAT